MSNDILQTKETDLWRCTVCGRFGTVGRCCGEETRERVTMEQLLAENEALLDALRQITEWPDGGNRYGQENIKRFAQAAIDAAMRKENSND